MGLYNVLQVLKISVRFKLVQNIVMEMEYVIMESAYAHKDMILHRIVNFIFAILIAQRALDQKN